MRAEPPVIDPAHPVQEPVLLVSYPKSGNTWIRIFLSNYLADHSDDLNIDDLRFVRHIASPEIFEHLVGYDAADLSRPEIDQLRARVHENLRGVEGLFPAFKVHDAFYQRDGVTPYFPVNCGRVVYIVRNPLDVCVSLDHHYGLYDLDKSMVFLSGDLRYGQSPARSYGQLPQFYGSWSDHVLGWTQPPAMKRQIILYEDLCADPAAVFTEFIRFLDLDVQATRLQRALLASRFDRLQAQEQVRGFKERLNDNSLFFRSGRVGGWRQVLSPRHVDLIIERHAPGMRSLGYLDARGKPVY